MGGWFRGVLLAGTDVKFGGFGHAVAEGDDLVVGHLADVLVILVSEQYIYGGEKNVLCHLLFGGDE